MRNIYFAFASFLLAPILLGPSSCGDGDRELLLGVTTSVQDAGLLDVLVDEFESRYNFDVKPIVGGSGQIIEQARRGELDAIMTHSPADEAALLAEGIGVDRTPVMQNFFLIAGPHDDSAGVRDAANTEEAFHRIAAGEHGFVSRGDNSGTHRREQVTWKTAGINPVGKGWYTESATGQGQNLLVANDNDAYTLVDSSTFITFRRRLEIVELFRDEGRPNVYSVVRLDRERLDTVNSDGGDAWLDFMTTEGQRVIAEFGSGEYAAPLFEPLSP
jgi:tungstate transport system substrate-binding protein